MTPEDRQRRSRFLLMGLVLVTILLVARLAQLQVMYGAELDEAARRQRVRPLVLPAPRGEILDRNGLVLAGSRPAFTASLVYTGEPLPEDTRSLLKEVLGIDDDVIDEALRLLAAYPFRPARLKVDLSSEEHTRLEEWRHRLPGVVVEILPVRWYPEGSLASHVVGHVRAGDLWSVDGAYGIEFTYNGLQDREDGTFAGLTGTPGEQLVEVDAMFRPRRTLVQEDPVPGNDVVLTLDARLQAAAESALAEQMEFLRETRGGVCPCPAAAGSVVILRVDTGEILAMVSLPDFDPNAFALRPFLRSDTPERDLLDQRVMAYQEDPGRPLLNRAIQSRYAPGSVFKMITGMAGIEAGYGNQTLYCPGHFTYGNRTVRDWSAHGQVDLIKAIGQSCNVFFWTMGTRVGVQRMGAVAAQFGLDGPSGLEDLAHERPAAFPHQGDPLNVAIGQGEHQYAPLHIANYIATIANGGIRYRPYLVSRLVTPDGEVTYEATPEVLGTADIDEGELERIREGMRAVTGTRGSWWGTAYSRFLNVPYVAAGKTGTVERGGRFESSDNHGWFAGYAPAGPGQEPEIAIAVIIEGGGGGSFAAAPVARQIFDVYFGIRPSPLDNPGRETASSSGSN